MKCASISLFFAGLVGVSSAAAAERVLTGRLHHLRVAGPREWSDFPLQAEGPNLALPFQATANEREWSLRLRQQDVRQTWKVRLNGKDLGRLAPDENDMVVLLAIPPKSLAAGDNVLLIEQAGKVPDDVRIGEIILHERPVEDVLSEAMIEVAVKEEGRPLPCRITVLNAQGALMSVGAVSKDHLAVRPGVIYTGTGVARFGLPAGDYTLYAGRGFEYGISSARISVKPGNVVRKDLSIRREVSTPGYVSCDTHIHTLTHSGHGDASIHEQMLTIAGEAIELPIATDHNRQIDFHAAAVKQGVRKYFTPVAGNEVTTPVGHFNILPVRAGDKVPDHKVKDWKSAFANIAQQAGARIVILNHPRDRHSGFRPFGPERHNALLGQNLDGWKLQANGMEVINSGALQTDSMQLYRDWFGLLNRGIYLTPVGASDSHDVARYFVGQARTYIRCRDDNPGKVDVDEAVESFVKGRVNVSCGLLAQIVVNGRYRPGDLAPASDSEHVNVAVRVLGPSWVTADQVELFANGARIREAKIEGRGKNGIKWEGGWKLPRFRHDVHLVAIASGPGMRELYWPIARPYQATSPQVDRRVIGSSGAVWLDGDGDGQRTCAFEYAQRLAKEKTPKLILSLAEYDEAVAAQVAGLLHSRGVDVHDLVPAAKSAGAQVARGFEAFLAAWRECQVARSKAALPR